MIDKSHIDPNALTYCRMLKDSGFTAYIVGGAVRDLLLGKHPKDFDIATNATPHQIKRIIPYGRIIGRRFRHVMLERDGGRYEIVTFRGPIVSQQDEADGPEAESEEAGDTQEAQENVDDTSQRKQHPDLNQFGTAEQDALRRDFTINALFFDPEAEELVDYVAGKQDVDNHLLRTIGDPMVRMEEDPIRILRAIRHKAKLDLQYEPALEEAMRAKAPFLEQTSKDRIREEFLKVCVDHSLAFFLEEAKRLGLLPYFAPWFSEASEEEWQSFMAIWKAFAATPVNAERPSPEMGVSLMMTPLVKPLVLDPYKASLEPGTKNYLPDMKYFLSSDPLRNYFLRNLRVSRIQTDHVVRALFYWSRMTGLWLQNGAPHKIVGKLHHHPPAVLAAKMAVLTLRAHNADPQIPEWLQKLADYDPHHRNARRPHGRQDRDSAQNEASDDMDREEDNREEQAPIRSNRPEARPEPRHDNHRRNEGRRRPEPRDPNEIQHARQPVALPPPENPLVWNGPLHAPVLRPIFNDEPAQRWARKNQTIRAYRPSGIPNPPLDHVFLKANIVANYKPEITTNSNGDENNAQPGQQRDRGPRRNNRRNQGRHGGRDQQRHENQEDRTATASDGPAERPVTSAGIVIRNDIPEDSVGNIRNPGELPMPLTGLNDSGPIDDSDDGIDDNIGNRLDAPPTSGHIGVNGEGVLGGANSQQHGRGGHHGSGQRPRQGGGGNRGGRRRRGGGRSGGGGRRFGGGAPKNSG